MFDSEVYEALVGLKASIDKQKMRIYDANGLFAETPISTGMAGHAKFHRFESVRRRGFFRQQRHVETAAFVGSDVKKSNAAMRIAVGQFHELTDEKLRFARQIGVTGIVMTKLDGTARGGVLVAAAEQFGLASKFSHVSTGGGASDPSAIGHHGHARQFSDFVNAIRAGNARGASAHCLAAIAWPWPRPKSAFSQFTTSVAVTPGRSTPSWVNLFSSASARKSSGVFPVFAWILLR